MLLKNCRFVVTQNSSREILENADILVKGNKIIAIGKGIAKSHSKELRSIKRTIDCSNRIVMPGLINSHMHIGMSVLRGIKDDAELNDWLDCVIAAELKLAKKEKYDSAVIGIKESLRFGTTTLCDMYSSDDETIRVAEMLGARLVKFQSYYSRFEKIGEEEVLNAVNKHILKHALNNGAGMIAVGLGPHSIYGTSEEFLHVIRNIATSCKLLIHMHLSETRQERAEFKSKHGMLPVEYLEKLRFLGSDVVVVHAVWLTKLELDILSKHNVNVVHCPQSNMKLAGGGVMPLIEMQERGINVALGTDSAVSNNSLDMFREMHVCALLHKHHYWNPTVAPSQAVLDMATINGAKAIGRDDLGCIAIGKTADIIALDCNDENLLPCMKDRVLSHLVYSANGMNVSEVVVDGKIVLMDKKFC